VADAGADGGWSLTVTGNLADAGAELRCLCPTAVPDHLYDVVLPGVRAPIQIQVQPLSAFVPRLQWLTQCSGSTSCSVNLGPYCSTGSAPGAPLTITNVSSSVAGAPMKLVVGAESGTPGPYVLTLSPL
jgi:hypothetical protein